MKSSRTISELKEQIEYVERVNKKWKDELDTIDPVSRPVGYRNQVNAIQFQERVLARLRRQVAAIERKNARIAKGTEGNVESVSNAELFKTENDENCQ